MKNPHLTFALACALWATSGALAQSTLVQWTFDTVATGTKTDIAPSTFAPGLTASNLTTSGGTNTVGVVAAPFGTVQATGSTAMAAPAFEVGMSTTNTALAETSYAVNFQLTVGTGATLSLSAFQFDFGYDTDYGVSSGDNFYPPVAQLYISTDGTAWTSVGGPQTLNVANESIFVTFAGSGGVHFMQPGYSVGLDSAVFPETLIEGDTAYFRLALAELQSSTTDRRRIALDNITVTGVAVIPEPSTYALCAGALALAIGLVRRQRRA